jgi:glycosyltransferase involved in cell wall biosynthesis
MGKTKSVMKILFFIDNLNSGGKERRLTELMKGLKDKPNINFMLVVMNSDIHYTEVLDLNITVEFLIRKTRRDVSVFNKLYKICRGFEPDVIHCWDGMTAIYAIPASKLLGIKLVNGLVVNTPVERTILNKYWLYAKLSFPFSDAIIGNSKAGLTAYNVPHKKRVLIYNGFNFRRLDNLIDRREVRSSLKIKTTHLVGMVANFSEKKDYRTFFKAAEMLLSKNKQVTFIVLGNQTDSTGCKNLIKDHHDNFRLLGKKSDVESYVNAMDICVLSTFTEGISNSILEYMACSKAVIATSGGGTAEIVEDRKTGFLIEPQNPTELAEKIDLLLTDSALRNEMGINGNARIHQMFSIEVMTANYISCYRNLKQLANEAV